MPTLQFQHLTIVRLVSPTIPAPDREDDAAIQKAHVKYLGGLRDQGIILLNGPVRRLDDPNIRGMSVYSVSPEEARRYASEDPGVKAGWFDLDINAWLLPSIPTVLGDRVDSEIEVDF